MGRVDQSPISERTRSIAKEIGEVRFTRTPPSLSGVLRTGVQCEGVGVVCVLDRPTDPASEVGDLIHDRVFGGRRDADIERAGA